MLFLTLHLWLTGILLLGATTLIAMAGPFVVRRRINLDRLTTNNEVAGFKFAVIGVLYAVLLAFVVVISWERFHDAENALALEAGSAATVHRLAGGLGEPATAAVRSNLASYLNSVLADDWPAMVRGH